MGIADLFRPKYRHSNVSVRTEAVKALTRDDAAILEQIARTDRDIGVRRIAIEKIDTAEVLAELATAESERSLRDLAGERAARLWISRACGDDVERAGAALGGIVKLGDQHALVDVVVRSSTPAIRKRAFGELRDPRALAELAKSDAAQDLRTAAVARIDDGDVLRALAIDTVLKEVGLAAVEKLDDIDRLENVAQKAKNKAVRQKARKIVSEIEEAQRVKKPGVPDEVKRRRAERVQLLRELEGVADSFDFTKATEIVKDVEGKWAALGAAEDGDDRFAKMVERFWKRKALHDSQARSADELRTPRRREGAAEQDDPGGREPPAREAARDKERAEREAQRSEVAEPEDQAAREAREAESRARREQQAKQRAEDDARRQAQLAEREARAKEDAERGAAVAASLEAMCADMEQLASTDVKDGRVIDRLLAQAAKSFDQVGKVPGAARDVLAERYRAARGKLVIRASELKEAEDWARWSNVAKAEALIQTAKQMFEAPATPDLGNRLRGLQALWKEVGPMPQRRSKELWEQFEASCDLVYDKVKGVRAVENEKFGEVAKVKEALIAEAEAIADSEDFGATADRLKALQTQWKSSGHLPRKQGDELWKRFRGACDKFFERRKPMLEARHAEEGANLARKQQLIARAQAVSDGAPGEGGWGKAIGTIKDLQTEWKQIGYVPRRDADAVWSAFRRACDSLFAKRDASRDSEANAHRAEIAALQVEIDAVIAGLDNAGIPTFDSSSLVGRAIAVRAKAGEQGVLGEAVVAMVRHLIGAHPEVVKGTELDPAQLRARREKLIGRAGELLPKQAPASVAGQDVAAQLKQAMQKNAFGDLRFSGRDPIEVIDELRTSWAEVGPILDDDDRAQTRRFEEVVQRVLEVTGARERDAGPERGDRGDRGDGRRKRRDRRSADPSPSVMSPAGELTTHAPMVPAHHVSYVPDAAASATAAIAEPDEITSSPVPISAHDAVTRPAHLPPELPLGSTPPEAEPPVRATLMASMPPPEELDAGWDMGEDDPTATAESAPNPEGSSTPSSAEMAGDGATEGDGLDTGWD